MSPPTFRIVLYAVIPPTDTPEMAQYVAGLFIGYDAVPRWTCAGPTADAAREKMEAFWEKERKSHEPRQAPKKGKPTEAAAPEPVSEVADEGEVL